MIYRKIFKVSGCADYYSNECIRTEMNGRSFKNNLVIECKSVVLVYSCRSLIRFPAISFWKCALTAYKLIVFLSAITSFRNVLLVNRSLLKLIPVQYTGTTVGCALCAVRERCVVVCLLRPIMWGQKVVSKTRYV